MIVNNLKLDFDQEDIVKCNENNILVIAGAGSGKTLTIIGKIKYLLNNGYNSEEILCISFTNASASELKNKIERELNVSINVYTFHKLALKFIDDNFEITNEETIDNIIYQFLYNDVLNNKKQIKNILTYFNKIYINKKQYYKLINSPIINKYVNDLKSFIKLYKCNGYNLKDFNIILKKINKKLLKKRKYKSFLITALNIYLKYNYYLKENNEKDFDDLIIDASNVIKNNKIVTKYKYIIIDEYQDTSFIRFNLIKNIIINNKAKLMVVGDDFQSIYRFTGCNIDLFTNFKKYFPDAVIKYITNTYRNSNELIRIAGNFVMKNKFQIKKNLVSSKHIYKPIQIIYYNNIIKSFEWIINNIKGNEILVLGRNNKDINMVIDNKLFFLKNNRIIYINNKNIIIKYLTIHKSKGLESDNVIIINLTNSITGMPSNIKENEILKYITNKEKYAYSEERRLFYVALTRTKNYSFLLTPYKNKSVFIKELEKDNKKDINIIKKY